MEKTNSKSVETVSKSRLRVFNNPVEHDYTAAEENVIAMFETFIKDNP